MNTGYINKSTPLQKCQCARRIYTVIYNECVRIPISSVRSTACSILHDVMVSIVHHHTCLQIHYYLARMKADWEGVGIISETLAFRASEHQPRWKCTGLLMLQQTGGGGTTYSLRWISRYLPRPTSDIIGPLNTPTSVVLSTQNSRSSSFLREPFKIRSNFPKWQYNKTNCCSCI
jgi:hypothetical protein